MIGKHPFLRLQRTAHLPAGPCHRPFCRISRLVGADKIEPHIRLSRILTHHLPRIEETHPNIPVGYLPILPATFGHPRRLLEKRKAYGIQNRTLSRPCLSAYQKKRLFCKQSAAEVDHRMFD